MLIALCVAARDFKGRRRKTGISVFNDTVLRKISACKVALYKKQIIGLYKLRNFVRVVTLQI